MSVQLTARIPNDLAASLDFIANHFERPKSFCVVKALKSYIAEKMEELEDERDADMILERANDPNRQSYTSEEATEFLKAHYAGLRCTK